MTAKTLYFEGAGCVPCGQVENCRIRTMFHDLEGRRIYFEATGSDVTKNTPADHRHFDTLGFVHHCHYCTGEADEENHQILNHTVFNYTHAGILALVNSLGCDFDQIVVLPNLAGYRVFNEGTGELNPGDRFNYDLELTARREEVYKFVHALEKSEGKQYPNFSLWVDHSDPALLHLLRHFPGVNRHWSITLTPDGWTAEESTLGRYGC